MAVAVKLSRKLYETLGDEAAEAMVTWMDSMERNRAELRETSDMAFARIDARFGEMDARIDARFAEAESRMDARFREFEIHFTRELARVEMKIDQRFADLLKWSFTFWVGSTLTLAGALVVLSRFSR